MLYHLNVFASNEPYDPSKGMADICVSARRMAVILHVGIGSFHRAHQAWYLHRLIAGGDTAWTISVGSIRRDMVPLLDCLRAQNGEYTLETVTPGGTRTYERIRSIRRVVPWDAELAALVEAGVEEQTRIVSFTVTEAGYYLDDRYRLDPSHADLATDLAGGRVTVYGTVAAILRGRLERGSGPVTLLSCDNLRSNGDRFRAGLMEFLAIRGEHDLARYANEQTTFPNSMVDRITPRPNPEVRARTLAATGFDDGCPVMAESFVQWVIEDAFAAGRPAWQEVGATIVASVAPYEEAKIRLLNATHAGIAWAGTLAGTRFIHEGVADPAIAKLAYDYVTTDAIPCLTPSPVDLAAYRDQVLERFGNPFIEDTNQRVAADGYAKMLGWIVPTLTDRLGRGEPVEATAALPALFLLFLQRWHRDAPAFVYDDGVMDAAAAHALLASADPLRGFVADRALFGTLAGDARLYAAIERRLAELRRELHL